MLRCHSGCYSQSGKRLQATSVKCKNKRRRQSDHSHKSPHAIQEDIEALCRKVGVDVEGRTVDVALAAGYNAAMFDDAHDAFEDFTSREFCDLVPECGPVLYLDHWGDNASKERMRSTGVLLNKFAALRDHYAVHAWTGWLKTALEEGGAFSTVAFAGAYADLCTDTADEVIRNLEAICECLKPHCALCYTITGRDRHGETFLKRFARIHEFLEERGFRYARGTSMSSMHELRSPVTAVATIFYTRTVSLSALKKLHTGEDELQVCP